MGTTGGDRDRVAAAAEAAGVYAVVAPQMGKQVRLAATHSPSPLRIAVAGFGFRTASQ